MQVYFGDNKSEYNIELKFKPDIEKFGGKLVWFFEENMSENEELLTYLKNSKEKDKLIIENYSDKSFVVYGNTKSIKEELKTIGGKFNSNLRNGPGWIFSNKYRDKVNELIERD